MQALEAYVDELHTNNFERSFTEIGSLGGMTALERGSLRQLALNMLTREAGSGADAKTLAAATHRAYENLARVLVPLIGEVGVTTLTGRGWYLAQRDYPWLAHARDSTHASEPFAQQLRVSLERYDDPALAAEAAAVALASLLALLVTFIGEPLTMNVLRRAWPDGSSDSGTKETQA